MQPLQFQLLRNQTALDFFTLSKSVRQTLIKKDLIMTNNFLQVFEQEVEVVWGDITSLDVDETKAIWNTFKTPFLAINPKQMMTDAVPMFETVFGDVVIHDYGDALQQVIEYGETKIIPWVQTVGEHVLTAMIASWQASKIAKVI